MKPTIATIAFLLTASPALAQSQNYYDASGHKLGYSRINGEGRVTFYDARGSVLSKTFTSGNQTKTYDAMGKVVGRSTVTSPNMLRSGR